MPYGKRRKGKQATSSGQSTPAPSEDADAPKAPPEQDETMQDTIDEAKQEASSRSSKNSSKIAEEEDTSLVLTATSKRGVYECDYCHSDISQLPRIRCAVCSDFDLCLDCFATTDHTAAMARLKAAAIATL